jgi:hypothetical protein
MGNKQEQLQIVEHAITVIESKEELCSQDREIYKDLISLRDKINTKTYKVSWDLFLKIITHLLDQLSDHFFDS